MQKSAIISLFVFVLSAGAATAQGLAIKGETVHTMAGDAITDGVVLIADGKIVSVGPAARVSIPDGYRRLSAKVVTPGLIDARSVVGLAGALNYDHDQEQLESSSPLQPELRALDAYNHRDQLVTWLREHGVTTIHTGHAPGAVIPGQSMIVKTLDVPVEEAVMRKTAAVLCDLGDSAKSSGGKAPGTRAKMVAMLRARLIQVREYMVKSDTAEEDKKPSRDLGHEVLVRVLKKEIPLVVTANRHHDILTALRLAKEFDFNLILDGASEVMEVAAQVKAAGVAVILHPTMARARGDRENLSFETAANLREAGVRFAIQSGYESYVPKTRVVLFEAAVAAAHGLRMDHALASITIEAAHLLGIADRVGSLEAGKDADVVLFDGDPFEYTSHVVGVVINGKVVSQTKR